ncbi:MAG: ABC transporter substrate-binding protein [Anaerolineae bacterium]
MISRKATVLTSLTVILVLLLGGIVQAQDTVLTITWWGSQNRHDRTIEVIELFEAQNPGIDIEYEFSGWGDYWTRVNTQVAGGNMACIMQHDYKFMTEWAQRDLLLPLNELIESGAIDTSGISDSVIGSGVVNDEIVGISLGTNSQVYILDVDAFEAAGIELPDRDWTFDEFEAISNQFAEQGMWGMAYGQWDEAIIKSILLSDGQWLFNEDGTALAIEDSQPVIEYLNRIHAMMNTGAIPPMDMQADVSAAGIEGSPIVEGTEAMRYQWSNQVVALTSAAGEDRNFVLYPLPRWGEDGVTPNYLKPSMFFSITEGCETVDEAAQFIDFFTNSVEANEILFAERGVPVDAEIREYLAEQVDPVSQQVFEFIAEVSEVAVPVPPPDPAGYSDIIENVLVPLFIEPVLFGMADAEDTYSIFVDESNAILAQNAE